MDNSHDRDSYDTIFVMVDIKNWPALDFIKFICVTVMILVHAHIMLIINYDWFLNANSFFYKATERFMFVGLFLMILPMFAGTVFRINDNFELRKIAKLAIFLILIGFFMNLITWGWNNVFLWNVLQFIGLSFLIISFLKNHYSDKAIIFLSLLVIFAAEPLRHSFARFGHPYWLNIFFGVNNGQTFWPLFPWLGLVGLGFIFADYYIRYKDTDIKKFNLISAAIGVLLIAISILRKEAIPLLDPRFILGSSVFQPKIGFVLASIGFFCVFVSAANTFFNKAKFRKYGIVNSYSKGILWIYIFQMFASYNLAILIKKFFPIDGPSLAYFILPVAMIILSWFVGAMSIRLFAEKRLVITLKRVK